MRLSIAIAALSLAACSSGGDDGFDRHPPYQEPLRPGPAVVISGPRCNIDLAAGTAVTIVRLIPSDTNAEVEWGEPVPSWGGPRRAHRIVAYQCLRQL